jgi:23S rRNA (cytosine1962-C5)-methyltransferase
MWHRILLPSSGHKNSDELVCMASVSRQRPDQRDQGAQSGQGAGQTLPRVALLTPPPWHDYELIDSGAGSKLERFGDYRLVRPDAQAIWEPALSSKEWQRFDAAFQRNRNEEKPGEWVQNRPMPEQWLVTHAGLRFWARLTPFRHTGIFPEHSAHWEWIRQQIAQVRQSGKQPEVLVLFGYTGLHTLVAAQAGAHVCHVDASKPATRWARENQEVSQLQDYPIRWIVDDAIKFIKREIRRESRYDMIIMDPPAFGRGPKGEIWRLHESLQELVQNCTHILCAQPAGFLINAYATALSPISLFNILHTAMHAHAGNVLAGELVLVDTTVARPLPTALYARWSAAG